MALFAAMQQLIAVKASGPVQQVATAPVALYEPVKETEMLVRQSMPQKPDIKPRDLPVVTPDPVDVVMITSHGFKFNAPLLPKASGRTTLTHTDKAATPLVRIEPRYPVNAARDGISGWVKLGFSIDESGAVTDVEVLEAEPARTFNKEAIAALKRWKYQPKRLDGVAIKQTGLQVQLDFSLDNN
ncbi:energy transducer TonB [Rheinheimera gaetbuli]